MKKKNSKILSNAIIFALLGLVLSPFLSVALVNMATHEIQNMYSLQGFITSYDYILKTPYSFLFFIFFVLSATIFFRSGKKKSGTDKAGDGQFGFARYLSEKEKAQHFREVDTKTTKINVGGVVFGQKSNDKNVIYLEPKDECLHTLIAGITGSGKSRKVFFTTTWALALARESMVFNDVKDELYLGTAPFLKSLGYDVYRLNLRNPNKSSYINPIDIIDEKYKQGNHDDAISLSSELANTIVESIKPENAGENEYFYQGAVSTISAVIMLLIEYAPEDRYKTLANVRRNIARLDAYDGKGHQRLIKKFMNELPEDSLAKNEYDIANAAPFETEGGIISTALSALEMFSKPGVCKLTNKSDFDLKGIGKKPVALFITVPEERPKMNQLVSIMVTQIYSELVCVSKDNGNVLPNRVNFLIDEFSALPRIMDFDGKMSRGRAHGIRFILGIQDYAQLEKQYNRSSARTLRNQATYLIYFKSNDVETAKELSERIGNYTIKNESKSSSSRSNIVASTTTEGASLTGRALLRPEEIQKLEKDHALVIATGLDPALFYTPDLTAYQANKDFGMGNKEHNRQLFIKREAEEPERSDNQYYFWIYGVTDKEVVKKKNTPHDQPIKRTRTAKTLSI